MRLRALLTSILVLVFPLPLSFAATDGLMGASSTGSLNISITIPERVKISKIQDLNPPAFTGSGDRQANSNLCVYSNIRTGQYRVTARGSGSKGDFAVQNRTGHELPYTLKWNDKKGASKGSILAAGIPLRTSSGASNVSEDCGGDTNANVQAVFNESTLMLGQTGTYSGSVHLLVEPE